MGLKASTLKSLDFCRNVRQMLNIWLDRIEEVEVTVDYWNLEIIDIWGR